MSDERDLIIIGDRILIAPDNSKEKTSTGLFLPQGLAEKENVQSGYVVKTGPGYMLPFTDNSSEPWARSREPQYVPLQVSAGDYAIFLKRESIEIEYEEKKYLIIPQAGILAIIREKFGTGEL